MASQLTSCCAVWRAGRASGHRTTSRLVMLLEAAMAIARVSASAVEAACRACRGGRRKAAMACAR
eukprot:10000987-Lingulodinium_polyedra.AAC.1